MFRSLIYRAASSRIVVALIFTAAMYGVAKIARYGMENFGLAFFLAAMALIFLTGYLIDKHDGRY